MNFYPKLARSMLALLFAAFAASVLFIFVQQKFGLPRNGASKAATILAAFLLPPFLSTVQYLLHLTEKEEKKLHLLEDAHLLQMVTPLLQGLDYSVRVGSYPAEDINAFAISSIFGRKACIGFSTSLLSVATTDQLLAIAAHEVAHIKNGDTRNKACILAFNHSLKIYPFLIAEMSKRALKSRTALMVSFSLLGLAAISMFGGIANLNLLWSLLWSMIKIVLLLFGPIPAFMVLTHLLNRSFFAYSREREFAADEIAAAMTSPVALISALELLTDPETTVSVFDTHPPLDERKKRLSNLTI